MTELSTLSIDDVDLMGSALDTWRIAEIQASKGTE